MHKAFLRIPAALFAGLAIAPAPAWAASNDTYVATTGSDANDCQSAPCRTLDKALSQTVPGGVIMILDSGIHYGATITKSITIRAVGVDARIGTTSTGAMILINAGVNDKVVLDGLDIDRAGAGVGGNFLGGVKVVQARDVIIQNSRINGFFDDTGYGVLIDSASPVSVLVENTTISNGRTGIRIQSAGGFGTARVYNSTIAVHSLAGISVTGANNRAEIKNDEIIRAPKALEILNGGAVYSYGDNVLSGGDAPTPTPKQ